MAKRLRSPISRLTQAMIVLGISAVLVTALLNVRDQPILEAVEGKLLDIRFLLRGPLTADKDIQLVLMDANRDEGAASSEFQRELIARAIDKLTLDGANLVALGPSLIPYLEARTNADAVTLALTAAPKPAVGYIFSKKDTGITSWPRLSIPDAVSESVFRDYRFTDSAPASPFIQPTEIETPAPEILAAAAPGHVVAWTKELQSRHYSYPVMSYDSQYFPSLALQIARLSQGMELAEVSVIFGQGLGFGSFYVPTDKGMRLAVNYRGPAGSFGSHSLQDVASGKFDAGIFEGKTVILGAQANSNDFVVPYGGTMSDAEFLATVTSNYLLNDPLDRSQKVIILDIIMISLVGIFLGLLATLRNGGVVFVMATLAGALICFVNLKAFTLINLWLNLTFPLTALVLCTGYLVYAKTASNRREKLLVEAERSDSSKYATPWIAERVAKARLLEEQEQVKQTEELKETLEAETLLAIDEDLPTTPSQEEFASEEAWIAEEEPISFGQENDKEQIFEEQVDIDPIDKELALSEEVGEAPVTIVEIETEPEENLTEVKTDDPEQPEEIELSVIEPEPVQEPAAVEEQPLEAENVIRFKPEGPIKESRLTLENSEMESDPEFEREVPLEWPVGKKPEADQHVPTQEELEAALQGPVSPLGVEEKKEQEVVAGTFQVAVFYLDMSGFYSVSKTMGPAKTAQFLHSVQGLIDREVSQNHGFQEPYSSNGLMAVFGLPDKSPDDAFNALNSARNIAKGLATLIKRETLPNNHIPEFCLCLHSGPVSISSDIDDEEEPRLEINGDTVYVASQLENLVLDKKANIVASSQIMEKIAADSTTDFLTKGFEETSLEGEEGSDQAVRLWTWNAAASGA
ncbi:MAG: CHASE2 domain-containing protein [Proteobacteria bacterium]|nr:CHASE2 domain-containing protein [Pseudomonadota bacterium]